MGESEMREEERDVWEEMMQMDEYDMEQFSTLDNSEKNDRYPRRYGGRERRNRKGMR